MNGISTDWVRLTGVALGGLICLLSSSLAVMLVGNWLQASREARQRRYIRAKDRAEVVESYITKLYHLTNEIRSSTKRIFSWVAYFSSGEDPSHRRPGVPGDYFDTVRQVLKEAQTFEEKGPGIILGSLEPQILKKVKELRDMFRLLSQCVTLVLLEKDIALAPMDIAENINIRDWENIESWADKWDSQIFKGYDLFEEVYEDLEIAIENSLKHPSWVERIREWWGNRGGLRR